MVNREWFAHSAALWVAGCRTRAVPEDVAATGASTGASAGASTGASTGAAAGAWDPPETAIWNLLLLRNLGGLVLGCIEADC